MAEIPKYNTTERDRLKTKITTGPDKDKEIREFVEAQLKNLEAEIVQGISKEKTTELLQQQLDQPGGPLETNSAITLVATQAALVHLGYKPDMHGFLSAKTRTEITNFQKEWNTSSSNEKIKEDGIPGPQTVARLIKTLNDPKLIEKKPADEVEPAPQNTPAVAATAPTPGPAAEPSAPVQAKAETAPVTPGRFTVESIPEEIAYIQMKAEQGKDTRYVLHLNGEETYETTDLELLQTALKKAESVATGKNLDIRVFKSIQDGWNKEEPFELASIGSGIDYNTNALWDKSLEGEYWPFPGDRELSYKILTAVQKKSTSKAPKNPPVENKKTAAAAPEKAPTPTDATTDTIALKAEEDTDKKAPAAPTPETVETTPGKTMTLDKIFAAIEEKILKPSDKKLDWGRLEDNGRFYAEKDGLYIDLVGIEKTKIIDSQNLSEAEIKKYAELANDNLSYFKLKTNLYAIGKEYPSLNLSKLADAFKDHPDYKIDEVEKDSKGITLSFYKETWGIDDIAFKIKANKDGSYTLNKDKHQETFTSLGELKVAAFKEKSPFIKLNPEFREKAEELHKFMKSKGEYEVHHVYENKIHYTRKGRTAFYIHFNTNGDFKYEAAYQADNLIHKNGSDLNITQLKGYIDDFEDKMKGREAKKAKPKSKPAATTEKKEQTLELKDKDDTTFPQIRDAFIQALDNGENSFGLITRPDWKSLTGGGNPDLFFLEDGKLMLDMINGLGIEITGANEVLLDLNGYTKDAQDEILYKVRRMVPALRISKQLNTKKSPEGYPNPLNIADAFNEAGSFEFPTEKGIHYEDNKADGLGETGLKRTEFPFSRNGVHAGRVQIYSNGTYVVIPSHNIDGEKYAGKNKTEVSKTLAEYARKLNT